MMKLTISQFAKALFKSGLLVLITATLLFAFDALGSQILNINERAFADVDITKSDKKLRIYLNRIPIPSAIAVSEAINALKANNIDVTAYDFVVLSDESEFLRVSFLMDKAKVFKKGSRAEPPALAVFLEKKTKRLISVKQCPDICFP